ncbi:MAG: dTDP-4-dehydrorhamnose 3,5-epimerase [Candidatus Binatia bacterium]
MIFTETKLRGAYIIEIEKLEDHRGFNARALCQREFEAHGLVSRFVQANVLFNKRKGTLRGMHYQIPPSAQTKVFWCIHGAIYDVIIDLRPDSPTYKSWLSVELTANNYKMLYVPGNFAQGFMTLEDQTKLFYQASEFYSPEYERGISHDDPAFGIRWPLPVEVISTKDRNWPMVRRKDAVGKALAQERS